MPSDKNKTREEKRRALHLKYQEAVGLYATTDLPLYVIAERCHVCYGGLSSYLRRYQRELVLKRYHIPLEEEENPKDIKIIAAGKQSIKAHAKYKDAIAACDSLDHIDLNLSEVARIYNLDGTALANFMRIHYPEILVWREKVRQRLGINDNLHRGVRPESEKQYAKAVELYRTTIMSIPEIAEACHISESGFNQHLRFYHKKLLKEKESQRRRVAEEPKKIRGELLGNGRKYEPALETEQKYAEALELYRTTALTQKEIVKRTGVPNEGFRFYLHKWHKELVLERSGIIGEEEPLDLRKARRRMKTVAAKYERAIESLRGCPRPVTQVAKEFGFNPETFRDYLRKHEPDLAGQQGMSRTKEGKRLSRRSEEKYAEAIHLYETTTEDLKSIAKRLGLTYNSLGGYIRRNHPEAIERHKHIPK